MAKYICRRRLKVGDGFLMPGDEFPVQPYHNLRGLLGMGWLERIEDGQDEPARPSPAPAAAKPIKMVPDNFEALKKAELIELAAELGIDEVQGTGSDGFLLKSDLVSAIRAYQSNGD